MKARTPNIAPETKLHAILFLQMMGVRVATTNPRTNDNARSFANENSCMKVQSLLSEVAQLWSVRCSNNQRNSEPCSRSCNTLRGRVY